MKTKIEDGNLDTELEASDWRYAATILGLHKYFEFHKIENSHKVVEDCFRYDSSAITEEKYLEYVEEVYESDFHHKFVEQQLSEKEFTESSINEINKRISGNTIMKKVFGKLKFDGTNKEDILTLIQENRSELVKETYRYKDNLYRNYCNTNLLFQNGQNCCRLLGYYFDAPKKGKSVSYGFNPSFYCGQDIPEFDFIPFAFTGDRESFFVNNSHDIDTLFKTNNGLCQRVVEDMKEKNGYTKDVRRAFFKTLIESADFVNYDVEIIVKRRDCDFFETMFIRQKSIRILKGLAGTKDKYKALCFSYKINDNYYINVQKEVTDCILNLTLLDNQIELFLKDNAKEDNFSYVVDLLIEQNMKIRGVYNMYNELKNAKQCGCNVALAIQENKLISYRQKLTSAIVFKDYNRVCDILLQLSNYSDVTFDFAYKLFEDFETNKELAYTFINSLKVRKENTNNDKTETTK